MRAVVAALTLPLLAGCSEWLFSGESWIDRSRPVVLVETTGGIEPGAATEYGVLTLGRTATTGPCRVHYFLGPTPIVETGTLVATGSLFTRAEIDLKTQLARVLDRSPTRDDAILAMWTADGQTTESVWVELAAVDGIAGDVLADPGRPLPTGASLLCRSRDGAWLFAGLVAGRATVTGGAAAGDYYVFAGVDRVREMLAVPARHPVDLQPRYRTDDIRLLKPRPATGQ
ncbi:MAG: hypothetical protein WBO45_13940 [Planctomycetota bacterium]